MINLFPSELTVNSRGVYLTQQKIKLHCAYFGPSQKFSIIFGQHFLKGMSQQLLVYYENIL